MAKYTVVGGHGFIGSEIVKQLKNRAHEVFVPEKNDARLFEENLGVLIYSAGHGDCKNNPSKVFESNTLYLYEILERATFEKMIYISSTRLYMGNDSSMENSNLTVINDDSRKLFNMTKLLSEELCLCSTKNVLIVRPSNVYGLAINSPLFLPAITRDAIKNKKINMHVEPSYEKDYISVSDVANAIYLLSQSEKLSKKIYNIASGENTSAKKIADILTKETGCDVEWHSSYSDDTFPIIDISAIKNEVNFSPSNVVNDLVSMIHEFRKVMEK